MKKIYLLILLFSNWQIAAQYDVPITLLQQFNGKYDYTIMGNTHNEFDNFNTTPIPCQMLTQSSANLNLLPSQNIVAAYLIWSGLGTGNIANIQLNGITQIPDLINVADTEPIQGVSIYFSSLKNITNYVQLFGNGLYSVSNFDLNPIIDNYCSTAQYYSGWNIIVIYEDLTLPNKQLNIYNGFRYIYNPAGTSIPIQIPVNNLNVIDNQNATMTYIAWNGSPNLFFQENIQFNGTILSNALNPPNNPFNGTSSFTGSTTNWNQDIDTFDISPFMNIGDTNANITMNSVFIRFISNVITSIRSELPDPSLQLTQVTGQDVCGNRDLVVNYTVTNTNSNAALPDNIPVSFFANDVFLQTINTPSPIAVGATLPLQTTVSIPEALGNNIDLRVVVNQNASGQAFIPESNPNNNDALQNITLLGNTVTTAFTLQNSFCINDIVPVLPTLSDNGISGTWLPNVISNQTSGSYVFTPNAGQCAGNFTLNITISPLINPIFSIGNTFCQGANVPVLPLLSNNGISGTWLPNVLSNQTSGSYLFTPNAGSCGLPFTLNVMISPLINPIFSIGNTFCQGANVPTLPLISNNGISGTWLPNVISNQTSGSYVFTPNLNQCGLLFTLDVTISPAINPTFSVPNTFCQGANVLVLPLLSNNGISGTWLPNVISNQTSGSYVFTPNAGQCNSVLTLTVVIETPEIIEETLFICENDDGSIVFPLTLNTELSSGTFTFLWSENGVVIANTLSTLIVSSAGNYEVVASPIGSGCASVFNYEVLPLQPITVNIEVPKPDFEANQTIEVNASGGSGQFLYSFDGLPYQSNPTFRVRDGGSILVVVKDANGCYTFSENVVIWQYPRFFTPNNDGFNDTWGINTQKKITIEIFERYGKFIKKLRNNERWDGTYNSQILPSTDYWFVVYYDENKTYKSHFSLKR